MSLTPVNPVAQARKRYRRAMRARQTTLWVILVGSMLGIGVIAAAVYSGTLKGPWDRPFSSPSASAEAAAVRQPCPSSAKARYIAPKKISVNVLNNTDTAGLATKVQNELKARGFKSPEVGNDASGEITAAAVVRAGPDGINAAYTVATQVPGDVIIQLDQRTTKDVDLVLGDGFSQLKPADQAKISTKAKIKPVPNCMQVKAEPLPADKPAASPSVTKTS